MTMMMMNRSLFYSRLLLCYDNPFLNDVCSVHNLLYIVVCLLVITLFISVLPVVYVLYMLYILYPVTRWSDAGKYKKQVLSVFVRYPLYPTGV